jgi:protein ImuB
MYVCIHAPDFAAQAAVRLRPELRRQPVALLDGEPPLEKVFAINIYARRAGMIAGMSRLQAESFAGTQLLPRKPELEQSALAVLLQCAAEFSPRIELIHSQQAEQSGGTAVLDIAGSDRLFGGAGTVAESLRKKMAVQGILAHVAASHNFYASVCAARGLSGTTHISRGEEAAALGALTLDVLDLSAEAAATLHLWGVHDCALLAALPEKELVSRLGQEGKRMRQLARGEYQHLLVPMEAEFDSALVQTFELEDPVEALEPLLFLISRVLDELMQRAMTRALAIASLQVTLSLLTELHAAPRAHQRTIRPALPTQDVRTLLKLVQLELETYPPGAAIIGLELKAVSARPHRAQHGMFMPQSPEPGRLEVLLARLRKLLGEDRLGAPQLLDTHKCDSFRMAQFGQKAMAGAIPDFTGAKAVLRMCRPPVAIRVDTAESVPQTIWLEGQRYFATRHAGPWRKSGEWWSLDNWCREEWDVALADQKAEMLCRIAHDPASGTWYLQGTYD